VLGEWGTAGQASSACPSRPGRRWPTPSSAGSRGGSKRIGVVGALVSDRYDALHGRFVHVTDALDELPGRTAGDPAARTLGLITASANDPVMR
jgi:hypothetical protein